MTLPVVWLPEAEADLRAAKSWYDDLRLALGDRFISAIAAAVESISKSPGRFPTIYRNQRLHAFGASRMGLFSKFKEQRMVVIACFH